MSTLAERREQVVTEIAALEATLKKMEAQAVTDLQTLAADEVTGAITSATAAERRTTIEAAITTRCERIATLRAAVPALDERLAEEEANELRRKQLRAERALVQAIQALHSAVKSLSRELKSAAASGREVDRHRTLVVEAAAAYRELLSGEEFVWPSDPDEAFEVPEDLFALLSAGPHTPAADAAATAEKAKRAVAKQMGETLAWFARDPSRSRLRTLPKSLRAEGERILAKAIADGEKAEERRRKREKAREFARLG